MLVFPSESWRESSASARRLLGVERGSNGAGSSFSHPPSQLSLLGTPGFSLHLLGWVRGRGGGATVSKALERTQDAVGDPSGGGHCAAGRATSGVSCPLT